MNADSELWIVGKAIDYTLDQQPSSWEFQGVFDSKVAGVAACRDENYFIGMAHLNQVIPHEHTPWEKVWYPKLEPEPASENLRKSAESADTQ